jgi:hypothetical protein
MTLTLIRVAATLIGACLAAGLLALWGVCGKVERAINRWRWRRWLRQQT